MTPNYNYSNSRLLLILPNYHKIVDFATFFHNEIYFLHYRFYHFLAVPFPPFHFPGKFLWMRAKTMTILTSVLPISANRKAIEAKFCGCAPKR